MATKENSANFCGCVGVMLALAGTLLAALCIVVVAGLAVGFGAAAALCFAWAALFIVAARRSERE